MTKWVALLRGINVGGHKKLPMAELRSLCQRIWPDSKPQTYIASGNLVFAADGEAEDIRSLLENGIADHFGFDVPVCLIDGNTLRRAIENCPFPEAAGNTVHGFIGLDGVPPSNPALLDIKAADEVLVYNDEMIWLHTPSGFHKSKLAARLSAAKGASQLTARNLNSLRKLSQMLDS